MRTALLVILIVLVFGADYAGPPRLPLYGPHPAMRVERLVDRAPRRSGRLTWLGGFRLVGTDPAFGGLSALAVRRRGDGARLLLLSDGGNLSWFTLSDDGQARDPRFGELPGGPRTGWEKRDRDSESLTLDARGRAWVGFESANQIWRYAPGLRAAERSDRPSVMRGWDSNGGAEAMVRLADGRFVVLSETTRVPGRKGRAGLVFAGDPTGRSPGFRFVYRPARGFDPSDVAQLPNGDLLVLERQWLLPVRFRSRLAVVPLAALRPGAEVRGTEVGRIAPPWPTENYEGVAVTREGAATIVWLVSDNDQMWWRNSYLLKLRLEFETATARHPAPIIGRATGR